MIICNHIHIPTQVQLKNIYRMKKIYLNDLNSL